MKTILTALIGLLSYGALAQNFAVRLGYVANGTISNWPVQVQPIGTNTAVSAPFILMTQAQIDACKSTNAIALANYNSNQVYQAKAAMDANIARLLALYNGIPDARTELRSFANATNTLTTAQLTVATRKLADYTEKLMEFIQRLGPVLKELYKPEQDTAQ